jgi:glycosyltransferase involved in cell wall biosynthesis
VLAGSALPRRITALDGPGSGFGDASEAYLSGLRAAGVPVSWTPLGWSSNGWQQPFGPLVDLDPDLEGAIHADIANLDIEHDTVVVATPPIWHDQLEQERTSRQLVAYTTWETDRLPGGWVEILDRYDKVLVPSQFNRDTLASAGLRTPVTVVPHIARPVDVSKTRDDRAADAGPFVFYVIATWTARKAVLDVVSAFVDAFDEDDDVLLIVHTTAEDHIARGRLLRGGEHPRRCADMTWYTLAKVLAGRAGLPRIVLSTRKLDRAGVDALHARGNCFVSLSRGEGWGLGASDAGAHANPVVVTGWGGSLDMLPAGYPYCVEYDLVPTMLDEPDDWWMPRSGERWAKARVEHASALLRRIFENQTEARDWGRALHRNVRSNFGSAEVTRRLLDALRGGVDRRDPTATSPSI